MSRPTAPLTERAAEQYVATRSFTTGPPGFVAAVVELLPTPLASGTAVPTGPVFHRLRHGHLGGRLDGTVSVSSPPSPGLDVCLWRTAEDLAMARTVLAHSGLAPGERAMDGYRPAPVSGGEPGHPGAAVRVCLDAGLEGPGAAGLAHRWTLAHAIGPVLTAAFANSPLHAGRPTGWRSTRLATRARLGLPLATGVGTPPGGHPRAGWTAYALDLPAADGISFRRRLRGLSPPTVEDLQRHLDALPAPVQARGHLELTMIDAQPGDGWRVALAVTAALVDDHRAADEALAATRSLPVNAWQRAARDGLRDPALAEAAARCFVAAYASLARQGIDRQVRDAVADYLERYVHRRRCPADDVLDVVGATA